ncbi:MAG: sigma-70 family RNA polymerase sigma factor [Gammaproteobacteria bacterium]|nr:sigma-70 family RNA polymerase sigma factor [Gammaproteobacteria bacterium]
MEEIELIRQAQAGRHHAFRRLVLRYQKPLFKFLNGYGLPAASIDDVAQETFLRVYRHLHRYNLAKGTAFLTWLFTIAKHLAFDEMKREKRYQTLDIDQESTLESNTAHSTYETINTTQQQYQLQQALFRLEEPFRSAVVLSYIKELSLEQVAAIEQCAIGTIKSRVFRGKKQLRTLLEESQ